MYPWLLSMLFAHSDQEVLFWNNHDHTCMYTNLSDSLSRICSNHWQEYDTARWFTVV